MKPAENPPLVSKPLRLWPGIVIVILQWFCRFAVPVIAPSAMVVGIFGGIIFGLLFILWWAFFSRAKAADRFGGSLLIILSLFVSAQFLHISMATAMMGLMYFVYAVPVTCLAVLAWALITRNMTLRVRRISMIATILVSTGFWICLRTNGMDGETNQYFAWRWSRTNEQKLIENNNIASNATLTAGIEAEAEWPGFRGRDRNCVVSGVKINPDWTKNPPSKLWSKPVGPGCSSFAIHGPVFFTQEQRGDFEMVTCYDLNTGNLIWAHRDSARFWDSHAGAGPRSTPTLFKGKVYTQGATGLVNALNEKDGSVVWSKNGAADAGVPIPGWAYTGSPLVTDSLVYVAISGRLLAYDILTGKLKWSGSDGGESYSSPQLMTIGGVQQVVFMNKKAVTSFNPMDGTILWKIDCNGIPIVQPSQLNETDLLLSSSNENGGLGIQRVTITNESGKWSTKLVYTTKFLKPYFNDFVIDKGCAFGFDGPFLTAIDVNDGSLKWRGARYTGEIILVADQDLMIVLTEKGDIALVKAQAEKFSESGHIKAITGKTWNHPALAGNVLLVRNGDEMAAFKL